ncbi:MAG: NAD-dependent epimerase/dehydratase family protein [Bdellovibrionaceae bacterium]|nr:NAD-dependent epimerase/dehydratase family protein [Pseudobdellovibrionaceae bacterium]
MKVLVTGANGFLGSWLTQSLVENGHEVFALVRDGSNLSELQGVSCNYLYGDITDLESLNKSFGGIDTVFHLAGLIAYKKSDRKKMEAINVGGTANVIAACLSNKVRRLVYLSSVTAIGASVGPDSILNEDSPYTIQNLDLGYFETKRKAEALVKNACIRNGLDCVILNPSTIYGPGDAKKGSRKTQVKVAQGKFKFFTSGGVSVVAVEDVVEAILSAWKNGRSGERYILSGENITIQKLFELIAAAAGAPPPKIKIPNFVIFLLGWIGDALERLGLKGSLSTENAWTATMYHWFDNSKARKELGFSPRPAHDAIQGSVNWMKKNGLLNSL